MKQTYRRGHETATSGYDRQPVEKNRRKSHHIITDWVLDRLGTLCGDIRDNSSLPRYCLLLYLLCLFEYYPKLLKLSVFSDIPDDPNMGNTESRIAGQVQGEQARNEDGQGTINLTAPRLRKQGTAKHSGRWALQIDGFYFYFYFIFIFIFILLYSYLDSPRKNQLPGYTRNSEG